MFENVAYGLRLRGVGEADTRSRVGAILEKLGLAHLSERYPDQLSGGQQQRVAICRALVYEPKVLLLDEPLSNLDAKLREEARFWIRKLILDLKLCAILVTHDQSEALAVADRILLLRNGVIVQEGPPIEIYAQPTSFYAADFMGTNNVLAGTLRSEADGQAVIEGEGWKLAGTWQDAEPVRDAGDVRAVIRVELIAVADRPTAGSRPFEVEGSIYLGDKWEYRLRQGGMRLRAQGPAALTGDVAHCTVPAAATWLFNP